MKLDFESIIERFTRNLTPAKIIIGILVLVIALAVLNFLVGLATTLLPIAVLAIVAYFGYQWLNSRTDTLLSGRTEKQAVETEADHAMKADVTRQDDAAIADTAHKLSVEAQDSSSDVISGAVFSKNDSMKIPPKINEKTGLPEADISRLEQAEQESVEITDSVMAQLAERRKRLLGEDGS
ncbi:MAG: hypothetical protein ACPG7F_10150 [Aggregatilineales bacterium]